LYFGFSIVLFHTKRLILIKKLLTLVGLTQSFSLDISLSQNKILTLQADLVFFSQ